MSPSRKKRRLKRIRANRYGQSPNSQTHNPRYEHAALVGTGPRRGGHASDRVSEHHRLVRQRRDFMRPGVQAMMLRYPVRSMPGYLSIIASSDSGDDAQKIGRAHV